jgi:cysteinyl-tRNA synthetase
MANVWMHNGFLQVESEKMSKSLGNFFTIRELLESGRFGGREWSGEVLRLAMLRTHYRQPIDWTVKGLEESEKTLDRWYELAGRGTSVGLSRQVVDALADDLNTPKMLAELHALDGQSAHEELGANLRALGFLSEGADAWEARKRTALSVDSSVVEGLILARKDARAAKNWPESDRIRDELAALNVVVKDNKDGTTTWEVAR